MKRLTHGEIMAALGLENPVEFALRQVATNIERIRAREYEPCKSLTDALETVHRQTGRTTQIVVAALCYMSEGGLVRFKAHSQAMVDYMQRTCREYARCVGIDPSLVTSDPEQGYAVFDHPVP